jgi:hypothetical protein
MTAEVIERALAALREGQTHGRTPEECVKLIKAAIERLRPADPDAADALAKELGDLLPAQSVGSLYCSDCKRVVDLLPGADGWLFYACRCRNKRLLREEYERWLRLVCERCDWTCFERPQSAPARPRADTASLKRVWVESWQACKAAFGRGERAAADRAFDEWHEIDRALRAALEWERYQAFLIEATRLTVGETDRNCDRCGQPVTVSVVERDGRQWRQRQCSSCGKSWRKSLLVCWRLPDGKGGD